MSIKIKFLGAAGTVTGSKFLVEAAGRKILVDCGLFQGLKDLRTRNWAPFPVDPSTIDAVVLTHAHIDHSGYIPRLLKEGYQGQIHCTAATKDLCRILLPDTGHLLEEEAQYLHRQKASRHNPPLPLFTRTEAEASLERFVTHEFDSEFEIAPGWFVRFVYAGHILGAACAVIRTHGRSLIFSGDVGRMNDAIFYEPANLPAADALIVESTYGDQLHPTTDPMDDLEKWIRECVERRGVMIIPAFAVGRAQAMIHAIATLRQEGRIPYVPLFLNSPMATTVSELFLRHRRLHRLDEARCDAFSKAVTYVRSAEDSKKLNETSGPMILISASGMATGGRVLHHLKAFAPDPRNMIVLAGFQAAGTRGRALQDGAEAIKIHGQMIPVRASVRVLENVSAHGDYSEIIEWLSRSKIRPRKTFVVHGEPTAAQAMANRLTETFHWTTIVPQNGEEFELD